MTDKPLIAIAPNETASELLCGMADHVKKFTSIAQAMTLAANAIDDPSISEPLNGVAHQIERETKALEAKRLLALRAVGNNAHVT